jgi:predicted nucleotidyltransferase
MNFGLEKPDLELLENLVLNPLKKLHAKVFIFGSRATGQNQKYSDIDLVYFADPGRPILGAEISPILENIENSNLTIKVDLVAIENLAKSYRDRVLKEMIEV